MKKFKIIFLLIFSIILSSCSVTYNSREDVDHLSESELIKYVEERVFENISLVGEPEDFYYGDRLDYTFYVESRDISFKVISSIIAPHFVLDGANFGRTGDYYLYITIQYFEAIFEHYKENRKKLADEFDIDADDFKSIYIENYNDIKKAAEFITELDKLYAYNSSVNDSSVIAHEWELCARIYFNEFQYDEFVTFWIEPVPFSTDGKNRLKYDDVYEQIVREYVLQLKRCNFIDATIPSDIYAKYEENYDE